MADYPPNEIIDIIMVLGQCNNNYCLAARQYAEQFPNNRLTLMIGLYKDWLKELVMDALFADITITMKMMLVLS